MKSVLRNLRYHVIAERRAVVQYRGGEWYNGWEFAKRDRTDLLDRTTILVTREHGSINPDDWTIIEHLGMAIQHAVREQLTTPAESVDSALADNQTHQQ